MNDIFGLLNETSADLSDSDKEHLSSDEKASVLNFIHTQEEINKSVTKNKLISNRSENHMRKFTKRNIAAAAAVAVLLVSGTVYAAMNWSNGLSESLHITNEQKTAMEATNMASFVDQSVTRGDVTVTANQCIVDNYYAYISFKVSGYTPDEGQEPGFDKIRVTVDGKEDIDPNSSLDWNGFFYNGIVSDASGSAVYADGSEISTENIEEKYIQADGSMEYILILTSKEKGFFINKPVHIDLNGLGTVYKTQYTPVKEDTWSFDWTFSGSPDAKEIELNATLGDTGATVIHAEISPISLCVSYDFSKEQINAEDTAEDGTAYSYTTFKEAPALTGVRMKDGTLYPYLYGGPGSIGYENDNTNIYISRFATDRILDIDQIDSLLFIKSQPDDDSPLTEDNLFIVPVN